MNCSAFFALGAFLLILAWGMIGGTVKRPITPALADGTGLCVLCARIGHALECVPELIALNTGELHHIMVRKKSYM